jgi:hypothetical protein
MSSFGYHPRATSCADAVTLAAIRYDHYCLLLAAYDDGPLQTCRQHASKSFPGGLDGPFEGAW